MSVHDILKQPIKTGLLEHYIEYITMVQDWESIRVFEVNESKDVKEVILDYCYAREKNSDEKGKWGKCDKRGKHCKKQCGIKIKIEKEKSILQNGELKTKLLNNQEKHIVCNEISLGNMHKALLEDIFTERYIPELDEQDKSECKNKIVLYEYPSYTIFPEKELNEYALGLCYERQQIEILRQLASKFKVLRHGIKAALSAIIVRNHSHHIGSHVMPRATVKKIREMVIEFDIPETINNGEEIRLMTGKYETQDVFESDRYFGKNCFDNSDFKNTVIIKACKKQSINIEMFTNELIEAAQKGNVLNDTNEIVDVLKDKLDEYIQKKADFTAEIATEPLTSTKTMKFFDEVILDFVVNTPLMGNIGANEDVKYRSFSNNRLKIYFSVNGKPLTGYYKATNCFKGERYSHTELPYAMHCKCNEELAKNDTEGENGARDVSIALPGCLGEYAIYAFLENFIRNGIKHNKEWLDKHKDKDYKVDINVCELEEKDPYYHYKDEFYKVKIHDNVEISTGEEFEITKDNDVEKVALPEFLQYLISKPIVNDDGSLRKEALGIAEMKIMATLLRGSTDFTNMSKNLTVKKDEDGYLVYEFYVMKPKNVAIISNADNSKGKEGHKERGIWWFNSLETYKNHILKGESPASFKFVIIDKIDNDDLDTEYFKEITPKLPFRVLINNNIDNSVCKKITRGYKTIESDIIESIKAVKNSDCTKILEITWKAWMDKFIEGKGLTKDLLTLSLFFQQKEDEKPTKLWSVGTCNTPPARKSILTNTEITDEIYRKDYKGQKILMYDRHFGAFNQLNNKATNNKDTIDFEFHEAFDKNSSDFVHIHSPYHYEKNYELVEAALLKVLIIDERIAEVAHCDLNIDDGYAQTAYGSKERLLVAKKAGIFICTHLCINNKYKPKLLHQSLDNKTPIICVKIEAEMNDSIIVNSFGVYYCEKRDCGNCSEREKKNLNVDSIIIHQGILENFFTELKSKDYDAFIIALQEEAPYIVIDSGRGIPAKLPDVARFLPFSLLEDFIMEDRIAKYSLTKIIMSLIRR